MSVTFEDAGLRHVLGYLANTAVQPLVPRADMRYEVRGYGPYQLLEDGDRLATLDRPDDVLYVVYQRCHARLADYMSVCGWVPLHAALVSVGGRRALVLGDKSTGKTTLMLRLLYDGHPVEGDELVFTRDGEAVCLPRNFHVKPGATGLVPELAEGWAGLPETSTSDGTVITAFDPSAAGPPWRVRRTRVDAAFVLRANHGGAASCRPMSCLDLVASAVHNCFPTTVARHEVVRACSLLLGDVTGHELVVGELSSTARLLASAVDRVRAGTPC